MNIDINSIKRKLLIKYPFFGSVIANANIIIDEEAETAATDGKDIYYNPRFIGNLSIEEQVFVFAHEICHIAFDHIYRRKGKDKDIWNIATDAVINAFLTKDGLKMFEGGIEIEDAINYDAEELYEILLKEKDNEEKKYNYDYNFSKDGVFNTHNRWDKPKEKDEGQSQNKSISEKKAFDENRKEKKKQLEKLKDSLVKQASKNDSDEVRDIKDIGHALPIIDWKVLLKDAIESDVDWSYKNATIEHGVVTPHLEDIEKPQTEILLDTSGSLDEDLLKNFLRECKNILQTSFVKVGCFDTKFYGFQTIRTEDDIDSIIIRGGGGTDFNVAVNSFTRRVENKIIFTDGCATMPENPVNAIWIVFGERKIYPKVGKVIRISDADYENLTKGYYSRKTR